MKRTIVNMKNAGSRTSLHFVFPSFGSSKFLTRNIECSSAFPSLMICAVVISDIYHISKLTEAILGKLLRSAGSIPILCFLLNKNLLLCWFKSYRKFCGFPFFYFDIIKIAVIYPLILFDCWFSRESIVTLNRRKCYFSRQWSSECNLRLELQ